MVNQMTFDLRPLTLENRTPEGNRTLIEGTGILYSIH